MNELQVFTNKECGKIRVLKRNGEAWFVAVDVCKALDINNARQAVTRLDDDEKCTVISNDGRQMNIVSESGLYSLVLSSRKKEAKTFKRWVTHDILPEIRKTGGYNPEQSEVYKTKRLEIMAMNTKARIMKEQNKRLEIMLKNNELEGLSVTAIQAILNEHPQTEKTYSATEAAEMFGVSANKIGRLANAHGLKCDKYGITVLDKAKHCDKEVQSFRYNEKGIEKLKELLREE
jgi:prophage antirepressor-like protein